MELLLHAWAAERHRQLFVSVATLADHHPVYRAAETSVYVYAQLYVYMMCDQFVQTDVQTNVRTDQCTSMPVCSKAWVLYLHPVIICKLLHVQGVNAYLYV